MATQVAETEGVISLGDEDSDSVVGETDVTLVEFYTEWCGTCQQMKPMVETIAADTNAAVATINIESHLDIATESGAQSTPTFVLFVDGQPVKQLRGGQTEQSLRELIATHSD